MSDTLMSNLFDDDFAIKLEKTNIKDITKKIKSLEASEDEDKDLVEKALKSKKVTLDEKLEMIKVNVLKKLGKQKNNILVIKDKLTFNNYIDAAIKSGRIAIDTETWNSTDVMNTKLVGLCLYYPDGKQAYIPVNHVDPHTKERLPWQLTEEDCKEQLQRILDSKIDRIFHNAKFDYEVLKVHCKIEVTPTWDTIVAIRLIDENKYKNEFTSLKYLYHTLIDPLQDKYSIDELFENIPYAYVSPEIFAFYAATDSLMTDKLYLWELPFFQVKENERLTKLYHDVEIPIIKVAADLELKGVKIDLAYGERLKVKYTKLIDNLNEKIKQELINLKPKIADWRMTKEATEQTKQYMPKKSKRSLLDLEQDYNLIDEDGKRYKLGRPKSDQLPEDINIASPVQLAILFYDILGCPVVNKKSPRATGEEEMGEIAKKLKIPLCDYILEMRGYSKTVSTYIDVIPTLATNWADGRIRYGLNAQGTDTGRFASGGKFKYLEEVGDNFVKVEKNSINSQNIPSGGAHDIRLLFVAENIAKLNEVEDTEPFVIPEYEEIELPDNKWAYGINLKIGDNILVDNIATPIKSITYDQQNKTYAIGV